MAEIITLLTLIFGFSALTLLSTEKFSQPAIPAYIIAGIIAGVFIDQSEILDLAQIGIAFLVFIFGLKFDPKKLLTVEKEALSINSLQILLIGALSFLFAQILGLSALQSSYFSVASTLSSSLVGLELISQEVDKRLIHGRLAEAINLIQDLFALAAITLLSTSGFGLFEISRNFIYAIALILMALLIRKYLFDRIASNADGSTELLMLTGLSFLTVFIAASDYLGISIVVGSFAAGIAVARFPHNLEIMDSMGSIKDFFSAIFFVAIGALVSMPTPLSLLLTASLILLTSIVKPGLIISSLIHQGYDPRTSFTTGVSLDQVSEFSLIIAIQAWIGGTISEPLFQSIILAATLTMTSSAYTKKYDQRLYDALEKLNILESGRQIMPESNFRQIKDHVILIGYDIQGKKIAEKLEELDVEFVVMENDPEKISELRKKDHRFVYGNILNDETWDHSDPLDARLIISTAPFENVSNKLLDLETDTDVILRAEELDKAQEYIERGALYVIVPEILTAELMKEHLLGLESEQNYSEELRRRSLLEVRSYLEDEG